MDRGAWRATVPGVTESRTRLGWLSTQEVFGAGHAVFPEEVCFPDFSFSPSSLWELFSVSMTQFPLFTEIRLICSLC